jgi:protein involved in sex pheromone biosynthesis
MRRRLVLTFAALLMLSACTETLQGAYDDQAQQDKCDHVRGQVERVMC